MRKKSGTRAAHLLLEQPGRGVGRLALERVGADELAEIGGLVGGGEARLAVDHGAHLVEIHLAAEARRGQRGFRAGQASANDANPPAVGRPPSAHLAEMRRKVMARPPVTALRKTVLATAAATQRFAGDAHIAPCVQELGAHGAVEVDGRGVPVEDLPLEAGAVLFDGDGRDPLQQSLADAQAAKFGLNEQVFEVESRAPEPGGVVEEVEGKAGGMAVRLGYQAEIEWVGPKPSRSKSASVAVTASGSRS